MDERQHNYKRKLLRAWHRYMYIGVLIVFNLYVQSPEGQVQKFIVLLYYLIWHMSLSSSCSIPSMQDYDAGFSIALGLNGGLSM